MKKTFFKIAVLFSASVLIDTLSSCEGYDDSAIRSDIEQIKKDLLQMNSSLAELRNIVDAFQKGKLVTEVTKTENGYTLKLNDGETLTIKNGEKGADAPIIGVKEENGIYYWTITSKGTTDYLYADASKTAKLKVSGDTPTITVDAEGYWFVNGKRMTDSTGTPVKAQGSDATTVISNVEETDNEVIFTLADGETTISLPKTSCDFAFDVKEGSVELFNSEESKTLRLIMKDIVKIDIVHTPEAWSVRINPGQSSVSIQAPSIQHRRSGIITLNAVNKKGQTLFASLPVEILTLDDKQGVFILNEGNMTSENGSVIYITPEKSILPYLYKNINGTELGNVTQDMYFANQKVYFISQNTDKLLVADANTFKKVPLAISTLSSLSWPTHLAVIGNTAYIRDNAGIHTFDMSSNTLTFINGTERAAKNRMAVVDNKVFAIQQSKILVLRNGAIDRTIDMGGNVSGIVKGRGKTLYVSVTSSPSTIASLNANTYEITRHELPDEMKVGAGWGASPGISAKGDTIYFSNAQTTIYRHIFSQNTSQKMVDVKEYQEYPHPVVYNNLAVHPITGEVYFNTIKGYGWDFLKNDITVFDFDNPTEIKVAQYKNYTRFPAGIYFKASFQ